MADSNEINQDEIEALLRQVQGGDSAPAPTSGAQSGGDAGAEVGQDEIEAMLAGAGGASKPPASTANEMGEVSQSEIEALLAGAPPRGARASKPSPSPTAKATPASPPPRKPGKADDIDFLLRQTEEALASIDSPIDPALENLAAFSFDELQGSPPTDDYATLDLLRDVELDLKIELGRTEMFLEDVLRLKRGSVVALDKLAGDPVDIYVNGRLVARGEVLVLNDNFCVRVAELVAGNDLD